MQRYPFCVLERAHMLWGHDVAQDNADFLEHVDAEFYWRAAHQLIGLPSADGALEDEDDQERKDISSLARLLWHHGVETLVMMLGAYMQAPGAVHGYFLKCRTEDAAGIAEILRGHQKPKFHRLSGDNFSLTNVLNGIHLCTPWPDRQDRVNRLTAALSNILRAFTDEEHRWEYNSIKHGLRAFHGRFAIAFGIQEAPGIPAPPEAMEVIGSSRDASFFDVARPLRNATRQDSKVNFKIDKVSVAWSLEKVLAELQLLSILLHNTVSAMRIAGGAEARSVSFNYISDSEAEAFWTTYSGLRDGSVPTASMGADIDAREVKLATEKAVFASYKPGNA